MEADDLRAIKGHETAFEALVWALARTHPNPNALIAAFQETSETLKAHLVNLPLSEVYLESFEKTRKQILSRMGAPESP